MKKYYFRRKIPAAEVDPNTPALLISKLIVGKLGRFIKISAPPSLSFSLESLISPETKVSALYPRPPPPRKSIPHHTRDALKWIKVRHSPFRRQNFAAADLYLRKSLSGYSRRKLCQRRDTDRIFRTRTRLKVVLWPMDVEHLGVAKKVILCAGRERHVGLGSEFFEKLVGLTRSAALL